MTPDFNSPFMREYREFVGPDNDPKKAAEFLMKNPFFMVVAGLVALKVMTEGGKVPKWLKDCPPINTRVAGPWRGKGSFGHGFGPTKVSRK